jgi:hypothetical protein
MQPQPIPRRANTRLLVFFLHIPSIGKIQLAVAIYCKGSGVQSEVVTGVRDSRAHIAEWILYQL